MLSGVGKVIKWKTDEEPNTEKLDPVWLADVRSSWKRLYWVQSHLSTANHISNIMSFFAIVSIHSKFEVCQFFKIKN